MLSPSDFKKLSFYIRHIFQNYFCHGADELCCHVQKQGERWTRRRAPADPKSPNPSGVVDCVELEPDTEIRLVRWSAFRVMRTRISSESNKIDVDATDANESGDQEEPDILVAMYHSLDNTNVYKEYDLKELALELKVSISNYPNNFTKPIKKRCYDQGRVFGHFCSYQ